MLTKSDYKIVTYASSFIYRRSVFISLEVFLHGCISRTVESNYNNPSEDTFPNTRTTYLRTTYLSL
jgi:hypothetical protein